MDHRVAIVTGGASGIGLAVTRRLAADGYSVLAVDLSPAVQDLAAASEGTVSGLVCDLSADDAPDLVVAGALDAFGRIDVLVNNAGIGGPKSILDTPDELLDRFLSINLRAVFRLTRAVLPHMGSGGTVVNIASTFALVGTPNAGVYAATKSAIAGLTRQLAAEFGPRGIRVNALAPGLIETPMTAHNFGKSRFYEKVLINGTPFPRTGRPEDVAGPVAFLCSEDSAFVNGQVIAVDAGFTATRYNSEV